MNNVSSTTVEDDTRSDREWARKRAKPACESPTEKKRQIENVICSRASQSESQHQQRLASGRQS